MNEKLWEGYLNKERIGLENPDEDFRSNYQRDFDRIIFCSAFRRLQDKTQVFPLESNDYVRTRLTHSLEVASIARSLGNLVGQSLTSRYNWPAERPYHFGEILAAAALAHDIGNPPFGHSGEDTISHWFSIPENQEKYLQGLDDNHKQEFLKFEGNAQGFRILTRLQCIDRANQRKGGLQLSFATLGAFLKYPCQAYFPCRDSRRVSQKKYNFFESERELFELVMKKLKIKKRKDGSYPRHPLVYLLECADDISYTVADFMDGFRLGHASYETTTNYFLSLLSKTREKYEEEISHLSDPKDRIEYLGGKVIGVLVQEVAQAFLDNEDKLLQGKLEVPLTDLIPSREIVDEMTAFAHANIYSCTDVISLKVTAFDIIHTLLETFVPAVCFEHGPNHFDWPRIQLIQRLIPKQFLLTEEEKLDQTNYTRLRKVVDFIAGMTDSYALTVYHKLKGIHL